jgi:hypothetical protein
MQRFCRTIVVSINGETAHDFGRLYDVHHGRYRRSIILLVGPLTTWIEPTRVY